MAAAATAKAKAKLPEMTVKPSGKGHVITFGKYEFSLIPIGNIPTDQVTGFVNTLRNALRAYGNK